MHHSNINFTQFIYRSNAKIAHYTQAVSTIFNWMQLLLLTGVLITSSLTLATILLNSTSLVGGGDLVILIIIILSIK